MLSLRNLNRFEMKYKKMGIHFLHRSCQWEKPSWKLIRKQLQLQC